MAIWPISLLDFSSSELAEVIRTHFSSSLPTHNVQINTSRSVAPPFFCFKYFCSREEFNYEKN